LEASCRAPQQNRQEFDDGDRPTSCRGKGGVIRVPRPQITRTRQIERERAERAGSLGHRDRRQDELRLDELLSPAVLESEEVEEGGR
jgi:hypothetical protein